MQNRVTRLLTRSYSSVLRRGEEVTLGDGDGSEAQDTHHDQVNNTGLRGAVEGVVKPRYKTAHDQKRDARVVQPEVRTEVRTEARRPVENFILDFNK